jgi:hypothetical protein
MNGFRSQKWDPWLIVSQIIAIQTLYYLGLGFWVLLITFAVDRAASLDYFFSYEVRPEKRIQEVLFAFF